MSDDDHRGGDGPPPSVAARRSGSNAAARDAPATEDRRMDVATAIAGLALGLVVIEPAWNRIGWPLAAAGLAGVLVLALTRRFALARSSIGALRRLDLCFELLWRVAGWAVVGTGALVIASGQIAAGAALLAAGVANMASSHRVGGVAIVGAGIALGALGISHVAADRPTGGFLLVAIGAVVVMLGIVIATKAGRSARGLPVAAARSDVSRWRKR